MTGYHTLMLNQKYIKAMLNQKKVAAEEAVQQKTEACKKRDEWIQIRNTEDFSDLIRIRNTEDFSDPWFSIPATEERAITLKQLDLIEQHIRGRFKNGKTWTVARPPSTKNKQIHDAEEVNLYDLRDYVVYPATFTR